MDKEHTKNQRKEKSYWDFREGTKFFKCLKTLKLCKHKIKERKFLELLGNILFK